MRFILPPVTLRNSHQRKSAILKAYSGLTFEFISNELEATSSFQNLLRDYFRTTSKRSLKSFETFLGILFGSFSGSFCKIHFRKIHLDPSESLFRSCFRLGEIFLDPPWITFLTFPRNKTLLRTYPRNFKKLLAGTH